MKQTIARALLQPDKNFPIDCETLDGLQTNLAVVQALGNIVGDKAVLCGCEPIPGGAQRAPGYVFLRTGDYPDGEVVYWEGGDTSGGMYLHRETVAVTARGYEFPHAYTRRSLSPGVGSENYSWEEFRQSRTPRELEEEIAGLRDTLARLAPPPLGIVQMWAGVNVPDGYLLCNGAMLHVPDYPELYAAIGTAFNNTPDYQGRGQVTPPGNFRLPDLRGRFVVGANDLDVDYNRCGKTGGAKTVGLTTDQLPAHAHAFKDYYAGTPYSGAVFTVDGRDKITKNFAGFNDITIAADTLHYKNHDTNPAGSGGSHENRPPYYALAYIMKVRN